MANRIHSGGLAFRRESSWASSSEGNAMHDALSRSLCYDTHALSVA